MSRSGKEILENLKQLDYGLWVRTGGCSHLSEEQWDYVIQEFEKMGKQEKYAR